MCGIAALFAYGDSAAPVELAELRAIRDRMAARGPDGAGEWRSADERVALGHRRLSIIDLRAVADQPMVHGNGRLRIVFNGEIYNYRELRRRLAEAGHVFRTESDTEVLLHLYDRYGPDMVRHLRGMYAFALWDDARKGLFLARDPFGIKPLYYADDGRTIRIASQVKGLLAGGKIGTAAEPAGHVGFFLWGYVPDPYTLYRDIRALPAGCMMWIDRAGAQRPARFFDLRDVFNDVAPAPADPVARAEMLRDALVDSIAHHLIADVPVGVFLSAGLDSTTIVALAVESGAANLNTVTLGFREFQGGTNDETKIAEAVARQRGTRHQTRWVPGLEFAAERDKLIDAMDQPSIDGVNTYFVAKEARAAGLKVALSGLGGDELFGGYPSFTQVPKLVRALAPLAPLRMLGRAIRRASAGLIGRMTSPKYAGLLEYGSTWSGAYLLRRSLFMPWELTGILPREMVEQGLQELDTLSRLDDTVSGIDAPRLKVSAFELSWYMRNQLLRDADWAGMAHSLEIRVPFVDVELIRNLAPLLASAQPPMKRDMAATPRTALPRDVLERPKTGFVVPVRDWISGKAGQPAERGLRSWARQVYAAQKGAA
ncbi:MAG TPA: asparagine synthase (glutamine-hydrolyzing) [Alphaproteobacteria bacterium]